jgi:hypothetical protein
MDDKLKKVQEQMKCEHVRVFGEACDRESGGWWTCGCAVIAWKIDNPSDKPEHQIKQKQ